MGTRVLPNDLGSHFTGPAMDWLSKTGIAVETLIKHHVQYSPSRQQIVFSWPNTDLWQARNCSPASKVRYFTSGPYDKVCPIYYNGNPGDCSRCILTEDCLSAIKVATCEASCDGMPLLGTRLPSVKITQLHKNYSRVDVFLDEDKFKDAMAISSKLKAFGLKSTAYLDKRDPKHIPYDDLRTLLS